MTIPAMTSLFDPLRFNMSRLNEGGNPDPVIQTHKSTPMAYITTTYTMHSIHRPMLTN